MKTKSPAFSLIEVVIALGLFAFCIIGIVGLLPIAANATKSVSQESNANNIAESIAGIWQVVPRTNISVAYSNFPMTNLAIGLSPLSTNYFNDFGMQTDSNRAALRMEYEAITNSNFSNTYDVNLTFYWPAHSTNTNTTTKRTFNYIFTK